MKKNKFLLFTALIFIALGTVTTSCVGCVGDESCKQAVIDNFQYVVSIRNDYSRDGGFVVEHTNEYGGHAIVNVMTDCNCKITHIDGRPQN